MGLDDNISDPGPQDLSAPTDQDQGTPLTPQDVQAPNDQLSGYSLPLDSTTQTVVLSDEQFTALIDGQNDMNNNLFWIACIMVAVLGVLLVKMFWAGWRSHK